MMGGALGEFGRRVMMFGEMRHAVMLSCCHADMLTCCHAVMLSC
jgi:hypothetical protein